MNRESTAATMRLHAGFQPSHGPKCSCPQCLSDPPILTPTTLTMIPRPALQGQLPGSIASLCGRRALSTTIPARNVRSSTPENSTARPHTIDPRWLTSMKSRVGKCMMFGLKSSQVEEAGKILQQLARDWRELIAGSEGFLTDEKRRSLYRHNVVWGEMVRLRPLVLSHLQGWIELLTLCVVLVN